MTEPVRSTRNARVVAASRLHRARERRSTGMTLLEGPHVVAEAIEAGVEITGLFVAVDDDAGMSMGERAAIEVTRVEMPVLERLAGTETPRGPVAVIRIPSLASSQRDSVVLGVTDPGNAGTILRTAAAFGMDVIPGTGAVDLWSPKVIRSAAGAHFHTRICAERAGPAIATVVAGGIEPARLADVLDPSQHWSILVGSEAHGLAPDEIGGADVRVTIPMPGGTESLNASVAASIVMYELSRWRQASPLR